MKSWSEQARALGMDQFTRNGRTNNRTDGYSEADLQILSRKRIKGRNTKPRLYNTLGHEMKAATLIPSLGITSQTFYLARDANKVTHSAWGSSDALGDREA